MSYVETCDKHGQYHADYICGHCFEDQKELIRELTKELEESARLHGIGSSRDARLMARIAELEGNIKSWEQIAGAMQSLNKEQAERVSQLSASLEDLIEDHPADCTCWHHQALKGPQ